MGVKGLLQALRPVMAESDLVKFAGRKVAIDGYAWLHKAAFTAVNEVSNGQLSDRPTKYCMKKIRWLQRNYRIHPVVVLDGRPLPSKAKTNATRHQLREASRLKGQQLAEQGDTGGAYKAMSQAISISWKMVEHLLQSLANEHVEFIVAPYEADAQLGYLSRIGYVDLVISEDSDLLLFGCTRVCYKLNDCGKFQIVESELLPRANLLPLTLYNHDSLIILSAVSGCDYTDGVKGLGLKKAGKHVANVLAQEEKVSPEAETSPLSRIDRLAKELSDSSFEVSEDKVVELKQAFLTFKYQTVWDPHTQKCVRLTTMPSRYEPEDYLGPMLSEKEMKLICTGQVEPKSLEPSKLLNSRPATATFKTPPAAPSRPGSAVTSQRLSSFFKVKSPTQKTTASTLVMHRKSILVSKPARARAPLTIISDDEKENSVPESVANSAQLESAAAPEQAPERRGQKRSLSALFQESRCKKALRDFRSEKQITFS